MIVPDPELVPPPQESPLPVACPDALTEPEVSVESVDWQPESVPVNEYVVDGLNVAARPGVKAAFPFKCN